jgi:hypothetical protein
MRLCVNKEQTMTDCDIEFPSTALVVQFCLGSNI